MTGLVLEGGGVKGSYQIGAYYAFKKCNIKFDAIVGNSIGSFNAAMLVAGKDKELLKFWQSAEVGKILGLSKQYIDVMNKDSSLLEKAYASYNEFFRVLNKKGLDIKELKKVLVKHLKEEEIRKSKIDFGLDTVRLEDFKPLYLFKKDIPKGKLLDYIIASCYLPVFKMEKIINNKYYIDGGFFDKSPSNMLEKAGYNKIYIVALNGIGLTQKKHHKANIITIKPSRYLGTTLNVNKKEINYNIKLGFYDTIKTLKKLDGYSYIFKVRKNAYYKRLLRDVDDKLLEYIEYLTFTENPKEVVLKALEYIMKDEKKEYTHIYNPTSVIREIKKSKKEDNLHKFIKQLKLL